MTPKPEIAIISIGSMGFGIAQLLLQNSYPVITNLAGRSSKTKARAQSAGITPLSPRELISRASLILSIVPPKDALSLAQSIAIMSTQTPTPDSKPVYIDLNAISPRRSHEISSIMTAVNMPYIDGAILGFPPKPLKDGSWFRPAVITSGPSLSTHVPGSYAQELTSILNMRHVSDKIGSASGLKMCFASLYKGHTAINIQAFTTANRLGVLPALRSHLEEFFPAVNAAAEKSALDSQGKAYRWIGEMEEIGETFQEEGGWGRELFVGAAEVYNVIANETNLERESKPSVEEVVDEICEGLRRRKMKME